VPRRSSRRPARKRIAKDWVYTEQGYLSGVFSQSSGALSSIAQPLTIAQNSVAVWTGQTPGVVPNNPALIQGGYAVPRADPQVIYAVQGHVMYNPSSWALGTEFLWGWRLIIADMGGDDIAVELEANYSMWVNAPLRDIAGWRNDSNVLAEGRWYRNFGDASSNGGFVTNVRWSSSRGRRINEGQALFLWLEGAAASVGSARNRIFVRTLCKARGS